MKEKALEAMFNRRYVLNRGCERGEITAVVASKKYSSYLLAFYDIGIITLNEYNDRLAIASKEFKLSEDTCQYNHESRD